MEGTKQGKIRLGGIPANLFAFPLLVVITLLHIALVLLMLNVNNSSNDLYDLMENSAAYQADATSMQATTTTLIETSNTYVQSGGNATGSLKKFSDQLDSNGRGPAVEARFRTYHVSNGVLDAIERASGYSEQMIEIQLHAISLIVPVDDNVPAELRSALPLVALTPEEEAMEKNERIDAARELLSDPNYRELRSWMTNEINISNAILRKDFSLDVANTKSHVNSMRTLMWVTVSAIVLILTSTFILFYQMIIRPLRSFSGDISENQSIKHPGGVSEMRQLVDSYNGMWNRRNKLESILRSAAENDALTGLPNRYCFERDCDLLKDNNGGRPLALLMFDVNFLKLTNDTKGHLAGDRLIRTAAECIKESFGNEDANNCYRIGGDEFVAMIVDCQEKDIQRRISRFEMIQQRERITVSVGYSYTENMDATQFKKMMSEADDRMYEQKKQIHAQHKNNGKKEEN